MEKKPSLIDNPNFTKVLAFFLALILWFFVSGDRQNTENQVYETRRSFENIPIGLRNLGDDLIVTDMVGEVSIFLQGLQPSFDGLTPANLEAYVDLSGKKEGRYMVRVGAVAPPGMSVVRITPASVQVVIEDLISLQMPVEAELQGENISGMIPYEIHFDPQQIFIQGSRLNVDRIARVVFYLDIEEADALLRESVRLYPLDEAGNLVSEVNVSPEHVDVEVVFAYPVKDVPVEAVIRRSNIVAENIQIQIEPPSFTLHGPQSILDEVTVIYTEEIDLRGWENGATREIPIILPEGIMSYHYNETVFVRVILGN